MNIAIHMPAVLLISVLFSPFGRLDLTTVHFFVNRQAFCSDPYSELANSEDYMFSSNHQCAGTVYGIIEYCIFNLNELQLKFL